MFPVRTPYLRITFQQLWLESSVTGSASIPISDPKKQTRDCGKKKAETLLEDFLSQLWWLMATPKPARSKEYGVRFLLHCGKCKFASPPARLAGWECGIWPSRPFSRRPHRESRSCERQITAGGVAGFKHQAKLFRRTQCSEMTTTHQVHKSALTQTYEAHSCLPRTSLLPLRPTALRQPTSGLVFLKTMVLEGSAVPS